MSDLDQYLTDELVERAARVEWEYEWPDWSWERMPDNLRDFYMSIVRAALSAVLPGIIRQAKAEAWDEAVDEALGCGWIHDYANDDLRARNPYRDNGGIKS